VKHTFSFLPSPIKRLRGRRKKEKDAAKKRRFSCHDLIIDR
jgi:hypothetical protein